MTAHALLSIITAHAEIGGLSVLQINKLKRGLGNELEICQSCDILGCVYMMYRIKFHSGTTSSWPHIEYLY